MNERDAKEAEDAAAAVLAAAAYGTFDVTTALEAAFDATIPPYETEESKTAALPDCEYGICCFERDSVLHSTQYRHAAPPTARRVLPKRFTDPFKFYEKVTVAPQLRNWEFLRPLYAEALRDTALLPELTALVLTYLPPSNFRLAFLPQYTESARSKAGEFGRSSSRDNDAPWLVKVKPYVPAPASASGCADADADTSNPNVQSKFGGWPYLARDEPWPLCPECGGLLRFFLQLRLDHLPDEVRYVYRPSLRPFMPPPPVTRGSVPRYLPNPDTDSDGKWKIPGPMPAPTPAPKPKSAVEAARAYKAARIARERSLSGVCVAAKPELLQLFLCRRIYETEYDPNRPAEHYSRCREFETGSKAQLLRVVDLSADPIGQPWVPIDLRAPFDDTVPSIKRRLYPELMISGWGVAPDVPDYFELCEYDLPFAFGANVADWLHTLVPGSDQIVRDKVSGFPSWAQNTTYGACPVTHCGRRMDVLFEFSGDDGTRAGDKGWMFGDAGTGHVFQCAIHADKLVFGYEH